MTLKMKVNVEKKKNGTYVIRMEMFESMYAFFPLQNLTHLANIRLRRR